MRLLLPLTLVAAVSSAPVVRHDLRADGVPVTLLAEDDIRREMALLGSSFPFQPFSAAYVKSALADPIDWRTKGAVTPAKDQGAHGKSNGRESEFTIVPGSRQPLSTP
jgi:hypothetical protein